MTQQATTSNRFSRSSRPMASMQNRAETDSRRSGGEPGGRAGAARLLQAVMRTEGRATTFWRRLVNLPWE